MASDIPVCPVLVGRVGPVARLRAVVDEVAASAAGPPDGGARRIVLVAGEAGLGKSRLVAETADYARGRGFLILAGASFPQDRTAPFAPILDLLRAALGRLTPDEVAALVRPFARELHPLLPDLVPVPRGAGSLPSDADLERDRRQLFVALMHCLLGASPQSRAPVCLVVEDIHWCDDVSLDFLAFLVRGQAQVAGRPPLLVLATYRADDAEPGLRTWLGQMDRSRSADEIALAPLSRDETLHLLTATFAGAQLPIGLVDALHELAEGNPFRIEELIGSLVAAGECWQVASDMDGPGPWRWSARPVDEWRLPRSLYEAVRERVATLGSCARELLTLAAVVGRRFDFDLLQQLAQVDERTLLGLVKELVAARLVVEESGDRFVFRHALTRQAVYSELLARERLALHRTVAEMAEQLYGGAIDQHLDDLAYHFSEAGVWPKALAYAQLAAARAQRLYAPRAAVEQLTRAIDACQRLPEDQPGTLATLHLERARASDTMGDAPAAIADARAALDFAHQAGDRQAEWQALIDLGQFWAGRDYARTGPCFEAALDLARSLDDRTLIAHSLNRLGNWRINTEQPRDALPFHREALAIFERLGDRAGIAATLELLGMAAYLSGDLVSSIHAYERAATLMESLDNRPGLVSCLAMLALRGGTYVLGSATTSADDFAQAARDGERAIILAREIVWRAGETFALSQLAHTYSIIGEYPRALALAEEARALARSIDHVEWGAAAHMVLGVLFLDLLAYERAIFHFERGLLLGRRVRSRFWTQVLTGMLAWTHIQRREVERAASVLAEIAHTPRTDVPTPVRSLGERWMVFAHAYLALAQNDPDRALTLFGRVTAPSIDADRDGDGDEPSQRVLTPRPALGRAAALAALGQHAEAERLLRDVLDTVQRQGAPGLTWRTHLLLGQLCDATGRAAEGQPHYLTARGIVEETASRLPEPDLRDDLLRRMLPMLPRAYRPSARQPSSAARPGGLTLRESEVASMIAAGKTNREIAEALVLGERTIETHVSNILGKLELTSRREVARWAAEHGLTG